jgi:molybdopterin converting factor small subunit
MHVTVKLYASYCIGRFDTDIRNYPDGVTIAFIAEDLGLPTSNIIILRNGIHAQVETALAEGDTVSFLPLLDGG